MTSTSTTKMTFNEFMALPESTQPQELIKGVLIMAPAPKEPHQSTSTEAVYLLRGIVGNNGKVRHQPTNVHLGEDTVVQPDIFWAADNGSCQLGDDGYWHGAPDLIIEILSPSTEARDRGMKFDLYQHYGVREYWLIQPVLQFVKVYTREDNRLRRVGTFTGGEQFKSPLLRTDISVSAIFNG